jgi:hypothetical protein
VSGRISNRIFARELSHSEGAEFGAAVPGSRCREGPIPETGSYGSREFGREVKAAILIGLARAFWRGSEALNRAAVRLFVLAMQLR